MVFMNWLWLTHRRPNRKGKALTALKAKWLRQSVDGRVLQLNFRLYTVSKLSLVSTVISLVPRPLEKRPGIDCYAHARNLSINGSSLLGKYA